MNATRSVLVIGMFGAACFIVAGVIGLVNAFDPLYALFLLIGVAGIAGGLVLWRRV